MRAAPTVLLACLLAAAGCGGGSSHMSDSQTVVSTTGPAQSEGGFEAPMSIQTTPAPPITLRDQNGQLVKLRALRGKAVAITFVYTHCVDVCPLLLSALSATKHRLGKDGSRFAVLAVTVDPKRDTPSHVRHWLAQRRLGGIHYLLGTRRQLLPVWARYNIASHGDPAHPEQIEHSSLIYLVDTRGRLRLLYPAQPLDGKALVHDARLLARGA